MRIAYVIEDIFVCGGAERIVSEKANWLAARGHDMTIISIYRDGRDRTFPLSESVRLEQLDIPMAAKGNFAKVAASRCHTFLKALRRLNKAMDELQPDIVFFASTLSALLLPFCRTKARKVFESHLARKFTPYHKFFRLMERRADMVVCLTRADAADYGRVKTVTVIPNFINPPASFVSDYSVRTAIAVGRLEHQKGFDLLIDIWAQVSPKHPGWLLEIYGDGSLREALRQQIDDLGLTTVFLKCWQKDISECYCDASLHLMTSRYEGLPMTLLEAQAHGLPSICFDFEHGARDIMVDGETGIIVPQGDTQAFAASLDRMMDDCPLRRRYGEAARQVSARFSKEAIMQKWEGLINGLATE